MPIPNPNPEAEKMRKVCGERGCMYRGVTCDRSGHTSSLGTRACRWVGEAALCTSTLCASMCVCVCVRAVHRCAPGCRRRTTCMCALVSGCECRSRPARLMALRCRGGSEPGPPPGGNSLFLPPVSGGGLGGLWLYLGLTTVKPWSLSSLLPHCRRGPSRDAKHGCRKFYPAESRRRSGGTKQRSQPR